MRRRAVVVQCLAIAINIARHAAVEQYFRTQFPTRLDTDINFILPSTGQENEI